MADRPVPRGVNVHITYVDKEGPLIKIFAQTDKSNAEVVERILHQLRGVFETTDLKPKTMSDITVGLICCAKFEDDIYYRAKILNLDNLREYKITVFFIDHGNVAQVKVTDIRLLSKLQVALKDQRAPLLMEIKGLAEEFYLVGVAPKHNNQWDDKTIDLLRKALCNTDGTCTIHELAGTKIAKFNIPDADPAQLLINWNKGLPLPQHHLEEYLKKMTNVRGGKASVPLPQQVNLSLPPPNVVPIVQQLSQSRLPNLSQPPPLRMPNEISSMSRAIPNQTVSNRLGGVHVRPGVPGMQIRRPDASISVPSVPNLQFSTEMLTPGVSHLVFVSHVEDGPHGFAVQLQTVVDEVLTRMMLDLNNIEPQPITAPLNPGSICVGRYSGDNTLCRAIVMNVMDDKVKLYFADFGSSEVVPFSEVYQIPPQFVTPKVMSHRFTLANIKDVVYTEQEKKIFKDLVANSRNLTMKVTPPEANPLKQYCELYLNCKNIKTILAELSQAQQHYLRFAPVSTPLKGSQEKIFVSYVVNPGRFFVQLDENDYSLKQVMKYVADHCLKASHIPLTNLRPGEPCCALFDDGIWYRAEIIKLIPENKALINFVDFGNEEEIELRNLRQISPELVNSLKAQAVLCCLRGYESRYNVDEEISNRLEELILEQKLMMHVQDCMELQGQLNVLIVQLIDGKGVDINSQLEVAKQPPAPAKPAYTSATPAVPSYTSPTPVTHSDNTDGWEDTTATTAQSWGQSDSHGPRFNKAGKGPTQERRDWQQASNKRSREDKKSWRSREDGESGSRFNKEGGRRFNKDGEDKPWSRDENRGGRFNRDDESGGRFNRDDSKKFGERGGSGRFGDEEKGGRFNRDLDSRGSGKFGDDRGGRFTREDGGGRFNKEDGGGRFNKEDGGGRFNKEDGGGRFNKEDGGGRFNKEDGGGRFNRDSDSRGGRFNEEKGNRFNKSDDEKSSWRKKDDDSGGWKSNREDGGGWKPKGDREDGGGWKPRGDREGGGGWKPKGDREDGGGGDRRNRFDGERRGGGFNRDSDDRGSFRKPWGKGGGDGFSSKSSPKSPKPDSVGGMPHSPVKVGQTEKVEVCFTTSPLDFYVQLSSTFEELTQLMDKIATGCESGEISDTTHVQEKSGCLAKYSEDDSWYRAVVMEKSFDSVKVLFVDYGNEENVPLDKIKTLPEDMSTLPVQAVKCRLLGVPETAESEAFKAIAEGKPLKAQFVAKNFLTKSFEVVMVDEETNSNINVTMGASEEAVQSSLSKLGSVVLTTLNYSAGTTLTSQLTWFLSPSQFYLQPMASNPEFRAMMQAMQAVVRTGTVKQNNDLNVGDFVIARFKADKVLYRALVQDAGYAPKVQYVDYGNVEAVDSGNVWTLETEFATLPIQAISCCLAGVQPTGETWPKPDSTDLDSHFEAETLDCSVLKELDGEGDPRYLVKLVKQGEDVAQKIIEAGFAVAASDVVVGVPSELDTSLIVGQTLPVTLLRIQEDYTFFVQPATEYVELQSLEAEAGQGVKCVLSNVKQATADEQREAFTQLPANTYIIVLVDAVQSEGLQVTLFDGEGQLLALQENELQTVEKVCPMPVLNMHQKVWIAHASEDGIFLHKVVFADLLAELLQKLYEFYNESEPVEQEWKHGDFCCAKSVNDEQWYRAKILESGEETKVQYIDYGNSEVIPVSNLRQLDALFYPPHALALPVSLHVTWSVPVENLMELAGETEYNAVVLRNKDGWLVELVDSSGQSLTDKLVELGFAVALENSPFKRIVEGGRFAEGSDVPISVSFVDSPLQLWIHVGDDIELIEALQDRLQEAAPKLLPLKEATGIFAAKFSDGLWYRALKLDDSTVRFIDYGNSDVVDMSDIKALSPDFLEPAEGYAVKVELPVLDFKDGANEKLEELLISPEIDNEEEVIARILSVKENSIVADILKGGKSVVDILVEENLGTKLQKVSSGFVSNLNNSNDFFIQEVGCEGSLETIVNALSVAENFEPISNVNEGNLVAALYTEDGLWYRAKVTNKSEVGIEVLFIDYGNTAISSEFRTLPTDLAMKPALSKHCALQLPEGVEEWSESANEKFMEISAEGCTQFDIEVITEGDPAIVILYSNDNCVNEELKTFCDLNAAETTKTECASADLIDYDKNVYISHINSPNDFYVQLEGAEDELDALREELADISSFELLEKITDDHKEEIVGALFVDDELWYRAKVLNIFEEGAEVLFVDYGNMAIATQFVKLPETLRTKIPLALHCSLGKEDWSEEAKKYLVELGGEGTVPFSMKILEDSEPKIISLATEEKIVEKVLLKLDQVVQPSNEESAKVPASNPSSEPLVKNLEENIIKTVFLIHVNSPNDFYLHTAEATQLLADISERLVAAEEFPLLDEASISKGKIVAAQFDEDDLWYRAKIIEHSENETKVIFVDYGNSVKVAKVKELPDDLIKTPALAMNCSLVKPGDGEWSPKACETFNKLANEDGVSFDLKIVSEGDPKSVSLYINGVSVAEQLILASGIVTEEPPLDESEELENHDKSSIVTEEPSPGENEEFENHDKIEEDSTEDEVVNKTAEEKDETTTDSTSIAQDLHKQSEMGDMIMSYVSEKILDNTHKEMQQITEDLIAKATDSPLKDMQQSTADVVTSEKGETTTDNERIALDLQKQGEMGDMIMNYVGDKILDNTHKEMQQITEDLIAKATDSPLKDMQQSTADVVTSEKGETTTDNERIALDLQKQGEMGDMIMNYVGDKILDNTHKEMQQITEDLIKKATDMQQIAEDSITKATNLNVDGISTVVESEVDTAESEVMEEINNEAVNSSTTSNGICDDQVEEQEESKGDIKLIKETSGNTDPGDEPTPTTKHDNSKTDTDGSPPTPRRYNVDDHIVPGCISGVKLEDPSEK